METLEMQIDRITAENQQLREALEVYADENNWLNSQTGRFRGRLFVRTGQFGMIAEYGYELAQRALERKE